MQVWASLVDPVVTLFCFDFPRRLGECVAAPTIGILDCGSGNLRSVHKAIAHEEGSPRVSTRIDPDWDGLVLPGVGAFGHAMRAVRPVRDDLAAFLEAGKPFLGICLGLQILFESSEENPEEPGLGILKGRIVRIRAAKVPHIGWNSVELSRESRLFEGVGSGQHLYFVHSYAARPEEDVVIATCEHEGEPIVSAVERDNIYACQFHPEKSGRAGLRIVRNFVEMSRGGR